MERTRPSKKTDPSKTPEKASLVLALEVFFGLLLSVVSFLFFLNIMEGVLQSNGDVDTTISRFIYDLRTPVLTSIFSVVTHLGDAPALLVGTAVFVAVTWKNHRREAILFTVVLIMAAVANLILKEIIQRPRPAIDPFYTLNSFSFPSGHAMSSFVFYTLLSRFLYRLSHKSELGFLVALLSLVLVFLIGFSRIYLGVHYLSDVVAGFIAGFWIIITALLMERTLVFYRLFRERRKK